MATKFIARVLLVGSALPLVTSVAISGADVQPFRAAALVQWQATKPGTGLAEQGITIAQEDDGNRRERERGRGRKGDDEGKQQDRRRDDRQQERKQERQQEDRQPRERPDEGQRERQREERQQERQQQD